MRISSLSLATIHYYFNSLIRENATPKKQMKVNHLWLLYEQMEKARVVGTDHFLTLWGGGCWWDFRGECLKIQFERGADKKILGIKAKGGHQTNSFKFCSDGFCDKADNLPECQKPAFLMFKKFRFPPGSILPDPLLFKYYARKSNFTPPKCKNIKSYELKRIIAKKIISPSTIKKKNWNVSCR